MNRRGFLDTIFKSGVGSMILPCALTYQRRWVRTEGQLLYRSNVMGIRDMLRQCDREASTMIQRLDLNEMFNTLYRLKREREMNPNPPYNLFE